ncbi:MAG: hypothetical protein PVJ43_03415 [Gemmatimonadales bacterium]|jgi:hypothetical protein
MSHPDPLSTRITATANQRCRGPARPGFALVATLVALVIIGVLVAGGFLVAYRQARAVRAGVAGDAAFYAAEAGLNRGLARLDSVAVDSVEPGGRLLLAEGSLVGGDSYSVQLSRWDAGTDSGARYYLLAATGRAAGPRGGRRSVAAMIRALPEREFCCAGALETRGAVRLESRSVTSGLDVTPTVWRPLPELCGDVLVSDRPGVVAEAPQIQRAPDAVLEGNPPVSVGADPSAYGEVTRWIEELARRADLSYPGGTVLVGPRPTVWPNGRCAGSAPGNWGAPKLAAHPCFTYFPIIHVSGDLAVAGPGSGQGVLMVEGDLTVGGAFEFYGVVLVGGSIVIGGEGSQVWGGLRVGNSTADTARVLGGGRLQYSGCAVRRATRGSKVQGPHPLAEFGWFEILE